MSDIYDLLKLNRMYLHCPSCERVIETKLHHKENTPALIFCPFCYGDVDVNESHIDSKIKL